MGRSLNKVTIGGFKSIESLEDFELGNLNVLIGANGAGKSNFVDFFRLLRAMVDEALARFVRQSGGADGFFFLGPKQTNQISARLEFGDNVYEFDLEPTAGDELMVADERVQYTGGRGMGVPHSIGQGNLESQLKTRKEDKATLGQGLGVPSYVYDAVSSWTVYHFHDTSMLAPMRRDQAVRDRAQLRPDASNVAALLLHLRENHENSYKLVRDIVRLIAPFFDDFLLEPEEKGGEEKVRLEWRQKGSDYPFQPVHLSDGTLRFICLVTALQQPLPPAIIIIDEPELGLHPYAINLLAELIQSASEQTQVIVSTQSPTLLDHFPPEDVVIVKRCEGRSVFERLEPGKLADWLQEYSIGELWQKNVVQGGPSHE
ncbi:MAG: AAA family ATPase [Phycisphaerae bacterium]|nr:AAA family ATPase [Phycisphaerae bacterium]